MKGQSLAAVYLGSALSLALYRALSAPGSEPDQSANGTQPLEWILDLDFLKGLF